MSKKAPRLFFFGCGSCNNSCRLGALEQQHYFLKPLGIMMFFFDNFGFVLCFRTLIPKCLSSLANFLLLSGRMVFHHPIGRTTLGSGVKNDTIIYLTTFPQKQQKTIEEIRCHPPNIHEFLTCPNSKITIERFFEQGKFLYLDFMKTFATIFDVSRIKLPWIGRKLFKGFIHKDPKLLFISVGFFQSNVSQNAWGP